MTLRDFVPCSGWRATSYSTEYIPVGGTPELRRGSVWKKTHLPGFESLSVHVREVVLIQVVVIPAEGDEFELMAHCGHILSFSGHMICPA